MRPSSEYRRGLELVAEGYNDCAIGRMLDIPRGTIRDWRTGKVRSRPNRQTISDCPICFERDLDEAAYSYLLGMYLGDGCLSEGARQVFKLRISLDQRYHFIINECARAVAAVRGRDNVGFVECVGCVELYSFWKHWPCLFPQHGPGRKHEREIVLSDWQQAITAWYPKHMVRGLIHWTAVGT